jgi:hypothetical protein
MLVGVDGECARLGEVLKAAEKKSSDVRPY